MSCNWDLYCVDCDEELGLDGLNHWTDQMVELTKHVHQLAALAPVLDALAKAGCNPELHLNYDHGRLNLNWFVEHAGHKILPRDEYGRCIDECAQRYTCAECGEHKTCRRKREHNGNHHHRREQSP